MPRVSLGWQSGGHPCQCHYCAENDLSIDVLLQLDNDALCTMHLHCTYDIKNSTRDLFVTSISSRSNNLIPDDNTKGSNVNDNSVPATLCWWLLQGNLLGIRTCIVFLIHF